MRSFAIKPILQPINIHMRITTIATAVVIVITNDVFNQVKYSWHVRFPHFIIITLSRINGIQEMTPDARES
jgi:hypothetical protein